MILPEYNTLRKICREKPYKSSYDSIIKAYLNKIDISKP